MCLALIELFVQSLNTLVFTRCVNVKIPFGIGNLFAVSGILLLEVLQFAVQVGVLRLVLGELMGQFQCRGPVNIQLQYRLLSVLCLDL